MTFIAGQYLCTYNALSVGQIKDGITLEHQTFKKAIRGDNLAESKQDSVWRGHDVYVNFVSDEYDAAAMPSIFWPYGSSFLTMGVIGRCDVASNITAVLVLTAIAGTTAATKPATLTMSKTILAEGFPVQLLFKPDLREVPIRLQSYPYTSGNTNVFGTLT